MSKLVKLKAPRILDLNPLNKDIQSYVSICSKTFGYRQVYDFSVDIESAICRGDFIYLPKEGYIIHKDWLDYE
jgi:hypothetical protein